MVNTFAMTILLIMLGLAGKSGMAAEIGIIQGSTLALFYAFSANARSLILNQASKISAQSVMASRLVLLIPLAWLAYLLSVSTAGVEHFVAIALILRRCVEWLGEVHLSYMEHLDNKKFARKYLVLQVILLAVVLLWLLSDLPYSLLGLFIWALAPLVLSSGYIWKGFIAIPKEISQLSFDIMPHLGSTAIIGITVYVFRLLILMVVGKEAAGDLFTAFAIGGLTGGVFANALGPSIALHEQRSGKRHFPSMLKMVLHLCVVLGAIVFALAFMMPKVLAWSGKSDFFWMATGLSLIGGAVMVHAQKLRFRLLQHDAEHDVFGPDVMMNILLIAAVPFVYYLLGKDAMGGLYLLSSLLAFVLYLSCKKEMILDRQYQQVVEKIRMVIAIMLLFPIFFQISNGVFRDPSMYFNSGGVLTNLPIPLSVLACYTGIILLGGYRKAFVSFTTIFFTCILMVMASMMTTQDAAQSQAKLLLLIQFVLPMFAMVLGQVYNSGANTNYTGSTKNDSCFEKMCLYVLIVIVPLQLISTWYQGILYLAPSLGLFSIYQHLQYVPVIFVSAYLIALFALWQSPKHRRLLFILAPLMAVYAAASMSMLAIGMLLIGTLGLAIFQWKSTTEKITVVVFMIVAACSWSYLQYNKEVVSFKFGSVIGNASQQQDNIAPNISERFIYWNYYADQITTSPKVLLIGHNEAPDRTKFPSAHNYYLDFIYNFGLIALLPVLVLLTYTCVLIYQCRREIYLSPGLIGLCMVTLFLLLIDNSLKVGLRQPYPGIFTFFLWGLLLSRLLVLSGTRKFNCSLITLQKT